MVLIENKVNCRFEEIDVMKGIAITLVVLGHVLACFYDDFLNRIETMPYNAVVLWKYIYSFHMPLFMFVSGFVVFNPHKKYSIDQISKRCMSYLIPLVVFGILGSICCREEFSIGNVLGQYWYFRTLMIFLLLIFILDNLFRRFVRWKKLSNILVAISFSCVVVSMSLVIKNLGGVIDLIIDSSHLNWNFFYFVVGWLLRREDKIYRLCKQDWILPLCLVFMIVHVVYPKNLYVLFPLAAIVFTLNISCLLANGKFKKKCVDFGKSTKDIYILHCFFMLKAPVVGQYFESVVSLGVISSIVTQALIGMPICMLTTYLSYKIGSVLNRNKYISRYCFGYL